MRYLLSFVLALGLCGCVRSQPAPAEMKTYRPAVQKVAETCDPLPDRQVAKVQTAADAATRQTARQAIARKWLIAVAVASGLFAIAATAGKFLGAVPAWWAAVLAWVAGLVRVRSIIVAGFVCVGCIALAVWLPVVWDYVIAGGWIAVGAAALFGTWELSCWFYTGKWAPDGLVRLPKGWKVAKE